MSRRRNRWTAASGALAATVVVTIGLTGLAPVPGPITPVPPPPGCQDIDPNQWTPVICEPRRT
jgi:hypothetical protein